MPKATRKDDCCTGHDGCPPVGLDTASENVFINSKKAGRETDKYVSHGCIIHPSHQDFIKKGSSTVFINSLPAGRVDDPVDLAGSVRDGSDNVFIGG